MNLDSLYLTLTFREFREKLASYRTKCKVAERDAGLLVAPRAFIRIESFKREYLCADRYSKVGELCEVMHSHGLGPCDTETVESIGSDYPITFAILIAIELPHLIYKFLEHDRLHDHPNLPYDTRPPSFPDVRDGEGSYFQKFRDAQWEYSPTTFRKQHKTHAAERILPLLQQVPLDFDGAAANTFKVKIDPDFIDFEDKHLSRETLIQQWFVMKQCKPSSHAQKQIETEIENFKTLRHAFTLRTPFIVTQYASFKHGDVFYTVQEYADGGSLESVFESLEISGVPSRKDRQAFLMNLLQLVYALEAIHSHLNTARQRDGSHKVFGWHQDIKPANILVFKFDPQDLAAARFKLADLGLTHFRTALHGTKHHDNTMKTSSSYSPPELFHSDMSSPLLEREIDSACDMWSFGCVLSEAVVWLVQGRMELSSFRFKRMYELRSSMGPSRFAYVFFAPRKDSLLQCVIDRHTEIHQRTSNNDEITSAVLRSFIVPLLTHLPDRRPSAAHLVGSLQSLATLPTHQVNEADDTDTDGDDGHYAPPLPIHKRRTGSDLESKSSTMMRQHPRGSLRQDSQFEKTSLAEVEEKIDSDAESESDKPSDKPPKFPVEEALEWLRKLKIKDSGNNFDPNPLGWRADDLLKGRDYFFILHDTPSMSKHLAEIQKCVDLLFNILFHYKADDKLELYFMSSDRHESFRDIKGFRRWNSRINKNMPKAGEDTNFQLPDPLKHMKAIMKSYFSRRDRAWKNNPRPLSLFILTSGAWSNRKRVPSDMKTLLKWFLENYKGRTGEESISNPTEKRPLGIQFIQFGEEEGVSQVFKKLDNCKQTLKLPVDLIDHERWENGDVAKMLFGSLDPFFDADDDDDDDDDDDEKASQDMDPNLVSSPISSVTGDGGSSKNTNRPLSPQSGSQIEKRSVAFSRKGKERELSR